MELIKGEPLDGGDPACWARLVCPGCGAIETEGHLADCRLDHPVVRVDNDLETN